MRRPPTSLAGILKINIARPCASQKDIPFCNHWFSGALLVLGSVMTQLSSKHIRQNGFICFIPKEVSHRKFAPPKKPLKLVAWHRQSISHTLDPLTLEATDSWRLTLQVWWMQWLLVGGCKLANFQCFEAKDVLNRNLARAPFIAPYAEGNLDTPELRFWLPSLPTSSEGLKGFSSCKWFMFTCDSSSINIRSKMNFYARLKKRKKRQNSIKHAW